MAIKFTNFAYSTLASSITSGGSTLAVAAGHGARFPAAGGADYFYATLESALLVREIVKVTSRSTDTFTITRAQDNTTAQAFTAGASVSLRLNAAALYEAAVDAVANWAVTTNPIETIYVPSTAMVPRTTSGATIGTAETATNKIMIATLNFAKASNTHAQFGVHMPKSWDEGTVTFVPVWSHPTTTTNFGVRWEMQAMSLSDNEALDAAMGTAVDVQDTGGVTNQLYIGPASAAITIGGTPSENDYVTFEVLRNVGGAGDNMAVDARLHGVKILFTRTAWTDA